MARIHSSPNNQDMILFLSTIWEDGDVREARIFMPDGKKLNGFFNSPTKMHEAIKKFNTPHHSIYCTLNPVNRQLLFKKNKRNKVSGAYEKTCTSDSHITSQNFLFIDCDPHRDIKDISASNEELKLAEVMSLHVIAMLGKPLVYAASGNGYHCIYRHNTQDKKKVQAFLEMLNNKLSTDRCQIDTSVFNPSRIIKVAGSWSTKGEHTEERPWRKSSVISTLMSSKTIDIDSIEPPSKNINVPPSNFLPRGSRDFTQQDSIDYVRKIIDENSIGIQQEKDIDGKKIFVLDHCHFDDTHQKKDAAIVVQADGKIGYHCFHNSCQDKFWGDFKRLYVDDSRREFYDRGLNPQTKIPYNIITEEDIAEEYKETQREGSNKPPETNEKEIDFNMEWMHPVYKKYVLECARNCDAPYQFMYFSKITGVAGLLGNNVWVEFINNLYPNLYTLLIAKSTVFRKSTSMKVGTKVLRQINKAEMRAYEREMDRYRQQYEEWANSRNRELDSRPSPPVDNTILFPQEVTLERLLEKMSEGSGAGLFMYSEFGSLLSAGQKNYMAGFKQFLTDAYDCSEYSRSTKSGRDIFIETPCPSILAASTFQWIRQCLDESELLSGWMSRFLFCVVKNLTRDLIEIPQKLVLDSYWENLFYPTMRCHRGEFKLSQNARKIYTDFVRRNYDRRLKEDSFLESFLGRSETMVLKIALQFHLADVTIGEYPDGYGIKEHEKRDISEQALQYALWAVEFCNECIKDSIDQLTGGSSDDVDKLFESAKALWSTHKERVIVGGIEREALNIRHVYRKIRKKARETKEIVETLEQQEKIFTFPIGRKTYLILKG